MSRRQKTFLIRMIVVMSILTGALLLELRSFIQRPLEPSLGLPSPTAAPTEAVVLLPNLPETSAPLAPTPPPSQTPLCGGPPVMNILAIGSDYRYNTYLYGLSDVIKIVRV
ncbi:MAG TPA: hypothetical protein VHM28_08990, partial [Anaerolineales bacterium]|nr:hypothetical protein [Anaerolineales bacterium]